MDASSRKVSVTGTDELKELIEVARGLRKADLSLRGGRVVNVLSGELERSDIAVHNGIIAGLGEYDSKRTIDVSGKMILPGFIDSHMHLESSMLTPAEFARAALPRGTTAVVADPHEIANVLGKKGLNYILAAGEGLPLSFYFMLPSCVPATGLETSGARLSAADLAPFLRHERVLGLAEMMNYPGVLSGDRGVLRKLSRFSGAVTDGHAPSLSGKDLTAYVAAGISSDHECTTAQEAREKVRLGMTVFIREGSAAQDLEALLPAVTPLNSRSFCFCTDDLQAGDLISGGIDRIIRKAVRLGLDPITAIRMATINPSRHYSLKNRGAILPGYVADLVVIDNFNRFTVEKVIRRGRLAAKNGSVTSRIVSPTPALTENTIKARPFTKDTLRLRTMSDRARVMELIPGRIETKESILPVSSRDGYVISDTERDVLRLFVIERHKASGRTGKGLVRGFGMKSGALASTVAHDSHNIIVVGVNDDDILAAVGHIRKMGGGLVVVRNGSVMASLPLPIAGLMSDKSANFVAARMTEIHRAARALGITVEEPFSAMAFLALPVVPDLKLTDRGLVDVRRFAFVDLFV